MLSRERASGHSEYYIVPVRGLTGSCPQPVTALFWGLYANYNCDIRALPVTVSCPRTVEQFGNPNIVSGIWEQLLAILLPEVCGPLNLLELYFLR